MYAGDSLWTLGPWQVAGVLALSAVMWGVVLVGQWRVRRRPGTVRWGVAAAGFVGFVWLSPQVYYLFYWATFDGLPLQSVIKTPPGPGDLLRLLTFTEEASLSRHGQGVLGWSLLALAWRSPGPGVTP
ncbi:hypothetical protein JANAI62_31610 [Jannaschia pagri]|uniref:Uncharacterized protein n=1 Tax=Jannaschia pagri TaxID=2829797 RepID=A0ABQ4NQ53_9RHOB|nr:MULTISPECIES: hypothetical protein [unclassified Jannaschia]GIT92602.1 hypothetical protein JANAI61_30600 [Jannaschia sp. AI_61]GIT96538.1 hypothetical protein JANAI62_31610 [Jannaschia sp. AI_62]